MAWFQLLQGIHFDAKKGITYRVKIKRDDQGVAHYVEQPIFESDADLVDHFGGEKFRRLSASEAKVLLSEASGTDDESLDVPDASSKSEVQEAAEKGAAEIMEPPGTDVTEKVSGAIDAGLKVYRVSKGRFVVCSAKDNELLTEDPITRIQVTQMIRTYLE